MTIRRAGHLTLAFLAAVLLTAVLASTVQTQVNLLRLAELGAPITAPLRALTTGQDLLLFGPVMAGITGAAFLPAFAVAAALARALPSVRWLVFAMAGAAGLWAAFHIMGLFTPMPHLVAATRTPLGLLAIASTGLAGGALFARASRGGGVSRRAGDRYSLPVR